jgi:hypothetical protein
LKLYFEIIGPIFALYVSFMAAWQLHASLFLQLSLTGWLSVSLLLKFLLIVLKVAESRLQLFTTPVLAD